MNTWAVIPAAGNSTRMRQHSSSAVSKVFQELSANGDCTLKFTLRNFIKTELISGYVIALREVEIPLVEKIASSLSINVPVICVPGGATRQESVAAALAQLPIDVEFVAVHDAARAFCSPELIKEVINQAQHSGAAILATPAKSTLKLVNNNSIIETIDRSQIWEAQTPQVFKKNILLEAHQRAAQDQVVGTDECQLVERTGLEVRIVKGEDSNFKITTPEDLLYARWLLRGEKS